MKDEGRLAGSQQEVADAFRVPSAPTIDHALR
jgi:hypothetical protein